MGGMLDPRLAGFLRLAADTYRTTGVAEAVEAANRIKAHAEEHEGERPRPATYAHLTAALAAKDAHPGLAAFRDTIHNLPWVDSPSYNGAYVFIIGSGVLNPYDLLWFGLTLQGPDTLYPSHQHMPEELYLVLSGTADWQKGTGTPFEPKPPGSFIRHRPNEPHAMRTGKEPLLAMWTWSGDLDRETYRFLD
jgi:hypothetical protein